MNHSDLDNSKLLQLLALVFPDGSPAEFGRRLSHEYEQAFKEGHDRSRFSKAVARIMTGQLRWGRVNRMLHEFALNVGWSANDVKMGGGEDNHVKILAPFFSITCHHVAVGQVRPANAKYLNEAYELNGLLSQMTLFDKEAKIVPLKKSFSVQIQHSASPERASQVEEIDFVFADPAGTLARFSISDLITCQGELNSLPVEDLNLIRKDFREMGFDLGESA